MLTIAVTSFKEVLRKKIFVLVGLITLIYLGLFTLITWFYVRDINRSMISEGIQIFAVASQLISVLGFYFSSMLVAFLTIMASVGAISSEIENGSIHAILTKPLHRQEYVLGKYLGLAVLMVLYAVFLYISVIVICMILKLPLIGSLGFASLFKGMLYFALEPLALLSLSILGSACFKTLTNGILVLSLYIFGLIGGMMEQIGALLGNGSLATWGIFSSLVAPFDVIYRQMLSAIFTNLGISNPLFGLGSGLGSLSRTIPSPWMILYIFLYLFGLPALAVWRFNRRDIS